MSKSKYLRVAFFAALVILAGKLMLKLNPDYVPTTDLESEFDVPVATDGENETETK